MSEYQGSTDKINSIKLESSIDRVIWTSGTGCIGGKVGLEVNTHFVGNNSDIKIDICDKSGKVFDTIKSKISGNFFWTEVTVPEKAKDELYAEVKISKLGLSQKSNYMYVYPHVMIKNLKWDKKEARRGDILKLTADVENIFEGAEAEIQIWEHDTDEWHDLITKFPVVVKNKKIEAYWEYEYHEDTDEIPTAEESEKGYNPPEYFFRVILAGVSADSDLLEFKDWIEIKLVNEDGLPIGNIDYEVILPDGSKKTGTLDDTGIARLEDIPPGNFKIIYKDLNNEIEDTEVEEDELLLSSGQVVGTETEIEEEYEIDKNNVEEEEVDDDFEYSSNQ